MPDAAPPNVIRTIDSHVAGAPVRLVVDGWPTMTGRTLKERLGRLQRRCDHLRIALMHEPRGHAAMSGALLLEPSEPSAHAGLGFMHHAGWAGYCGHALIGAAAVALQRGLVHHVPGGPLRVETVAGVTDVQVEGTGVRASMPAASLVAPGLALEIGKRAIAVDLAWCAGLYVFTDAEIAGVPLDLSRSSVLAERGSEVRAALARAVFPGLPEGLRNVDGITFVAPDERGEADLRSATVYADGSVDRSPGGGATAALVCVLDAMRMLPDDRQLLHAGPYGTFGARVLGRAEQAGVDHPVLQIEIEAEVHVTGEHTFVLNPEDPSVPKAASTTRARPISSGR